MSNYTPQPGSFSLFKNDRKEKDTHPDYKGDGVALDGTPVWVNAWMKKTKDGKTYMSCNLKPKDAQTATAPKAEKPADDFDDLPF